MRKNIRDHAPKDNPPIRVFSLIRGLVLFVLFVVISITAVASVMGVIFIQDIMKDLPNVEDMRTPNLTSVIYDRHENVIARLFEENRTWSEIGSMSPWAVRAILAAEDSEFYEHRGIRIKAIIRAALNDLRKGAAMQGGSTITQQVARLMFLNRERTLKRKASEAILAIKMEKKYTKDQILEMYMNMAYFGQRAYGITAAAQNYFAKDATKLSLSEASMLAGLLPAPNEYNPIRHIEKAKTRQRYVLNRMVETGMITEQERSQAFAANLTYAVASADSRVRFVMEDASYFVSNILFEELLPKYGRDKIYKGGLTIRTTIDLELQKHAESVISKMKFEGALVCLDSNTGEILALVGGRNYDDSKFNRATQAFRQPGSAFKPIVYATAFENGFRPVDTVLDAPLNFPNGWSPKNSDAKYSGEVTLVDALSRSINTVAVRLAQVTGVPVIMDQARRMGITTPYLADNLSLALGSSSLTPIEMATAFSVFGNNGHRVKPYGVKEIIDSNGNAIEQNGPVISDALSPETAVTIRSLLMQAVSWGTGTRANLAKEGYQTFGKTGTTNDWTDVWFVGGTPDLVTVVYVGNDDHKTLGRAFGGTVAAPVWKEFMEQAVKIMKTPEKFQIPSGVGVENVTICRATGFRATKSCPNKANILMATGQAPESYCPWHGGDAILANSDANAPELLLTPEDETLVGQYQLAKAWEEKEPEIFEPIDIPVALPEAQYEPYKNDPAPANEFEQRYQELLKQYNIM
ncbi:MAG: PBP1A family penicillin-binding protein [Synergistaceae bacterium]|jgi:penicillin-binding protein 1A|nr:PBP1A family penicillin-binding protein [Synergistaceae bacterium]